MYCNALRVKAVQHVHIIHIRRPLHSTRVHSIQLELNPLATSPRIPIFSTAFLSIPNPPLHTIYYQHQKHITSKRLTSPYTSGTKLGFISRPIKSVDAFLPKYGIKS